MDVTPCSRTTKHVGNHLHRVWLQMFSSNRACFRGITRIGSPVSETQTAKRALSTQAGATKEGEVLRPNNQSKHTLFVLQNAISQN